MSYTRRILFAAGVRSLAAEAQSLNGRWVSLTSGTVRIPPGSLDKRLTSILS